VAGELNAIRQTNRGVATEFLLAVEAILHGNNCISNSSEHLAFYTFERQSSSAFRSDMIQPLLGEALVPSAAPSFPSTLNSVSGIANSVKPQSMQTSSLGNTNTRGLSRFFSPDKWTSTSASNSRWFSEQHALHATSFTHARTGSTTNRS